MTDHRPKPGVSRSNRISDEGLIRLEKQLKSGTRISDQVLVQWVRRYGTPALALIRQHGRDPLGVDEYIDDKIKDRKSG
ncbi:MAG: hypothetical protein QNJ56_04065 [Gammaproteobacteria bacterium]|nr:hypothetical protein [Gammaproteobacteria bacterium]